jgi:hypothetical protein
VLLSVAAAGVVGAAVGVFVGATVAGFTVACAVATGAVVGLVGLVGLLLDDIQPVAPTASIRMMTESTANLIAFFI